MCSKTTLGNLAPLTEGGSGMAAVEGVSASWVKSHVDQYIVLDVTEDMGEDEATSFEGATAKVSLGRLIRDSETVAALEWYDSSKTIVTLCATGVRAKVAAEELQRQGIKATYVNRGILEWKNPRATKPGLVVVLSTMDKDKVSIAMSACAVSQKSGVQTVLVGMATAVRLFRQAKAGIPEEELIQGCWAGEPFQKTDALLTGFLQAGGVILLCTTCVKNQEVEGSLQDCATLMQLPDLLRMQQETKATLSF